MIADFISRMIALRSSAVLEHWAATGNGSYSRHTALGELYGEIDDRLDSIVETYQGLFSLIDDSVKTRAYSRRGYEGFLGYLAAEADWIDNNRKKICNGSAVLDNMLMDFQAMLSRSYYKLRNLS